MSVVFMIEWTDIGDLNMIINGTFTQGNLSEANSVFFQNKACIWWQYKKILCYLLYVACMYQYFNLNGHNVIPYDGNLYYLLPLEICNKTRLKSCENSARPLLGVTASIW